MTSHHNPDGFYDSNEVKLSFLTRLDGLRGSSQRLSSRYKIDHFCLSTPYEWARTCKQIWQTYPWVLLQSSSSLIPPLCLKDFKCCSTIGLCSRASCLGSLYGKVVFGLTWVCSLRWSSEKRTASASLRCFITKGDWQSDKTNHHHRLKHTSRHVS